MAMDDDKIIKLIIEIPAHIKEELDKLPDGCRYTNGWNIATAIMNGIPYEDRLQGEWITESYDGKPYYGIYARCSLCGHCSEIDNFCGYCGARMVEGKNNEKI